MIKKMQSINIKAEESLALSKNSYFILGLVLSVSSSIRALMIKVFLISKRFQFL